MFGSVATLPMLATFLILRYKYTLNASNYPQNQDFSRKKRKKIRGPFAAPAKTRKQRMNLHILRFFVLLRLFGLYGPVNRALDD